jgi:hypothetical protein
MSKLHHIGLGRAHKGRQVKLLIADQNIRVITLEGELIRELTPRPKPRLPAPHGTLTCLPSPETSVSDVRTHNTKRMKGFEPSTFAMARRRSSQLSYIRKVRAFYPARRARTW